MITEKEFESQWAKTRPLANVVLLMRPNTRNTLFFAALAAPYTKWVRRMGKDSVAYGLMHEERQMSIVQMLVAQGVPQERIVRFDYTPDLQSGYNVIKRPTATELKDELQRLFS